MKDSHYLLHICISSFEPKMQNITMGGAAKGSAKCCQCMRKIFLMLTVLTGSFVMPATASTVFTDNTFNLADYTIETFQSGGATIDITQSLTLGNPGSALQVTSSIPTHSSTFYTKEYFLNTTFLYDPGTQGAIQSIDFSNDTYVAESPAGLVSIGDSPILFQGGNYYIHGISLSLQTGTWLTASKTGLLETDFILLTDPLTGANDPTSHPDFTSGIIQFGTVTGTFNFPTEATYWDLRRDNLSYTVNTVPVPAAVWLFGFGLIGLIGLARRKQSV